MKVRVHQAVWRRAHKTGVMFGRAGGKDVYALEDVLWVVDVEQRLEQAGGPVDIWLDDNKVAVLPR